MYGYSNSRAAVRDNSGVVLHSVANRTYVSIFHLIVGGESPALGFPTAFVLVRKCAGMFGLLQPLLFIRLACPPTFRPFIPSGQFNRPNERLAELVIANHFK